MIARLPLLGLLFFLAAGPTSALDESLRARALILMAEDQREASAAILRTSLASSNAALRGRALRALGRIGDSESVTPVARRLNDPISNVRYEAAFALGEIQSQAAFDSLRHALLTSDSELVGRSAEALAKLTWTDPALKLLAGRLVVEALLAEDPASPGADSNARRRALETAWRFGKDTPGLVEALLRMGADSSRLRPDVADALVFCAARLRDQRLGEMLATVAKNSNSPAAASQAARGLGALAADAGDKARTQAVRKVLSDLARSERTWNSMDVESSDDEIVVRFRSVSGTGPRVNALRALGSFPAPDDDKAHAAVSKALASTDHHLQREALGLVTKWKIARALPSVRGMVTQSDRPDLQVDALATLVALDPVKSRPTLERFASSKSWWLRAAAAQALGNEGLGATPGGSALLDSLLLDSDPRVVAPATDSAVRSGREDAVVLVLAQLASSDPVVRAIAASHLPSLVGTPVTVGEAAQWLRRVRTEAAGETPPDARLVALDALVELLGPGARRDVQAALQDPDFTVRLAARRQAGALGFEDLAQVPVGPAVAGRPLKFYLAAARSERDGEVELLHLVTDRGIVDLELDPAAAPLTVQRILALAQAGWFDGLGFHRVVPDFVVQGGCPRGDGWGGPDAAIRCEINDLRYERGMLGMALSGKDTGGSQFFLTLSAQPHLDGGYTILGRVLPDSMAIVDQLRRFDTIFAAVPGRDLPAGDETAR